jgi:RNA polymerase sigma-70 factor (ECF subfamily)
MTASPQSSFASKRTQFEALVLPITKSLYHAALRLTHRPEDASDLVQETFLRAFRTFSSFDPGTNVKAWLFTILYSVFVNRYRKAQREPEALSIEAVEERFHKSVRAEEWGSLNAVLQNPNLTWHAPEVEKALRQLPEEFRTAVLLVDVEELSYEEAAAALDCPLGTLRSRLFRARKLLYLELQDYARRMGYFRRSAE